LGWFFFIGKYVAKASDYPTLGVFLGVLDATGKIYKGLEIGIPAVQKSQESGPFSEGKMKKAIGEE
jgi:hypothetical protein